MSLRTVWHSILGCMLYLLNGHVPSIAQKNAEIEAIQLFRLGDMHNKSQAAWAGGQTLCDGTGTTS